MEGLKLFGIATVIFAIIDFAWLTTIARKTYQSEIGGLLLKNPNIPAAILFYLIFIFGLVVFVIKPAVDRDSLHFALIFGALYGLVTYATYDLTNLATLEGWSQKLTLIDIVWGITLSASVAVATVWVSQHL